MTDCTSPEAKTYRPSNGTEGMMFQEAFCMKCKHDNFDEYTMAGGCEILANTMFFDRDDESYPKEWIWYPHKLKEDGYLSIGGEFGAQCTAFEERMDSHD